jgi:hypothetical protein
MSLASFHPDATGHFFWLTSQTLSWAYFTQLSIVNTFNCALYWSSRDFLLSLLLKATMETGSLPGSTFSCYILVQARLAGHSSVRWLFPSSMLSICEWF